MREIPHRYSNRKVNIPQSLYHYLERDILVRGACLRYGGVGKLSILEIFMSKTLILEVDNIYSKIKNCREVILWIV